MISLAPQLEELEMELVPQDLLDKFRSPTFPGSYFLTLEGIEGSGKSTQVPQFLYESGITLGNARARGEDDGLLIFLLRKYEARPKKLLHDVTSPGEGAHATVSTRERGMILDVIDNSKAPRLIASSTFIFRIG